MVGIAQVVMRARQHLVALLPMGDMVVMNTLRYHDELRAIEFDRVRGGKRFDVEASWFSALLDNIGQPSTQLANAL